jgi:hypothetical protein
MPRIRLAALAATLSCALLVGAVGSASAADTNTQLARTVAVTGATKSGKKLKNGTFTIDRFAKKNGKLYAIGTLTGRVGGKSFTRNVRMPASRPTVQGANAAQGLPPLPAGPSCQILNLRLGPINLNLLGLVVRTNRIHVRIDAVQGPGNLLGNLLCGLTGILDPTALATSPLGQLAQILNSLLALAPRTAA